MVRMRASTKGDCIISASVFVGMFAWDPGKAVWLRHDCLDFRSLGLDGAAWSMSCLVGSNQTGHVCVLET